MAGRVGVARGRPGIMKTHPLCCKGEPMDAIGVAAGSEGCEHESASLTATAQLQTSCTNEFVAPEVL